uniref:Secreted protein n=1 Tax=Populus trichocarpa TaxID=3694 RepID=U5GV83_POPTR
MWGLLANLSMKKISWLLKLPILTCLKKCFSVESTMIRKVQKYQLRIFGKPQCSTDQAEKAWQWQGHEGFRGDHGNSISSSSLPPDFLMLWDR